MASDTLTKHRMVPNVTVTQMDEFVALPEERYPVASATPTKHQRFCQQEDSRSTVSKGNKYPAMGSHSMIGLSEKLEQQQAKSNIMGVSIREKAFHEKQHCKLHGITKDGNSNTSH